MGARAFVWLGGAVFVASLAFCGYRFLVTWANPVELARWGALAQNAILLSVFALHHSLFARDGVKQAVARLVPARLVRSVYVWVASLLFIAVCAWWQPIGGNVYANVTGWSPYAHALVQLLGVWLIARAVATIDPLELAGIREAAPGKPEGLQTSGPYRWVRHPLYLGWVLAVFGAAHMTGDRLAFAVITSLYLVIAVPWEERSLRKAFGEEYQRYASDVKWRIVPFIY